MNKTAIRNFATWARVTLQENMRQRVGLLGITPTAILDPLPASTSEIQYFDMGTATPLTVEGTAVRTRKKLTERLLQDKERDYGTAYQDLIETMASTWFNRLIAIRYMEVNDYFPDHMRVLSSDVPDKVDPDLVSTPFESDLEFTPAEEHQILDWKDHNQNDALFNFLLRKRCHEIGQWMPDFFEGDDDVSDYFLQFSYIDPNGIVSHLIHDIPEEDFQDQVQIIGWLYQYYNSEWKDEVFANLKKNIKVSKENIPAATQLFTPDWIVRYMVENSLGRLWLSGHPDASLQSKWKYYVPEAKQEPAVEAQLQEMNKEYARLQPEDLTLLDPCSGSGHILVYAFDVLMDIYQSQGYMDREAAQSILAHNLYGLDIDDRAYQLTYFSLMMKARQYDRRIFTRELRPQVYAVEESNGMEKWEGEIPQNQALDLSETYRDTADYLIDTFQDAKEYGSLITVEPRDYAGLAAEIERLQQEGTDNLLLAGWLYTDGNRLIKLAKQAQVMSSSFWVSATNPPYMKASNMNSQLNEYVKCNFSDYKSDLFSACMVRCTHLTKKEGLLAFLSPYVWMFISSYEKLRSLFIHEKTIETLIQFEYSAFAEATVPICTFVIRNAYVNKKGVYFRLTEYRGGMEVQRKKTLEAIKNHDRKVYFETNTDNFTKIPGKPVAYWVSKNVFGDFIKGEKISDFCQVKIGMGTGKNDVFVRDWWEVNNNLIDFTISDCNELEKSNKKFFPYNKGGDYRKWFGNQRFVLWFDKNGRKLMNDTPGHRENGGYNFYFHKGITWTFISSSNFGVRFIPSGFLFDVAGSTLFCDENKLMYVLGFLSSSVADYLIKILNPTLNFQAGNLKSLPLISKNEVIQNVNKISNESVDLSRTDWDSFETSWNFQGHPLVQKGVSDLMSVMLGESTGGTLEKRYLDFKAACEDRFIVLQKNEEKLNRIFIDLYGLQDELTPEVTDKDITVHKVFDRKEDVPASMAGSNYVLTKEDVMKSLLSYAVGCLFGRYSLDTPGLAYAGGEWDETKYKTFIPDDDNVLPITDEEYFDDDLPSFICAWLKKAFGRENFEANLEFLTDALGTRGATPKEKLRNYFLKKFYKDHCKTYQKRPIYWLFDSGKENGFKAFVYIHRWTKDTEGRVLLYLHKVQSKYETELRAIDMNLENLSDKRRAARLEKRKDHLQKQLAEIKDYDEILDHMANEQLTMDLDDGVKVNYEKMQTDREGVTYPILAKIK